MPTLTLPPLKHTPSPNFSSRGGHKINLIVCHDCESSYAGAIAWFSTTKSQVSAHLVLREDGGEVTQMVAFEDKAWHAVAYNSTSIGLEMAGFAKKGFGDDEWNAAAAIVAYLLHRFDLPNRWAKHGVGDGFCSHYDLGRAGGGHTDPTTDSAVWTHFCGLVSEHYTMTQPATWSNSVAPVPAMPAGFVPTPTVRRD
jgi:N-acetyl-anhydromuramyl-L-alanine amidase AmpD